MDVPAGQSAAEAVSAGDSYTSMQVGTASLGVLRGLYRCLNVTSQLNPQGVGVTSREWGGSGSWYARHGSAY